jgi:predicted Zn finger-like uncharacterized protein
MDVRCEKCQTEYELDEARLKPGGVTVKCTNCGHMFKIRKRTITSSGIASSAAAADRMRSPSRPEPAARPDSMFDEAPTTAIGADGDPVTTPDRHWMIRLENGDQKQCRELATLQQWIVAGVVTRNAVISRSGKTWKRLGDISDLAQYFEIADEARTTRDERRASPTAPSKPIKDALRGTMLGVGAGAVAARPQTDDDDEGRTTGNFTAARRPSSAPPPNRPHTPPLGSGTNPPPRPAPLPVAPAPAPVAPAPAPAAVAPAPAAVAPAPALSPAPRTSGPTPGVPPSLKAPPPDGRATAAWATDGADKVARPGSPSGPGPSGPFVGKLSAAPDEPAFAGRIRVEPSDEAAFETGRVRRDDDDDDDLLPARRGSSAGLIIALLLLVGGGAGFAVWYFALRDKPEAASGGAEQLDATQVAEIDAQLAPVDAAVIAEPAHETARAELAAEHDARLGAAYDSLAGVEEPAALAVRAHLGVARAQAMLDRAGLVSDRAEAEKLRKDAKAIVIEVATPAQKAHKALPEDAAANLAMAHVLRLQGKPTRDVRRYLDAARAQSRDWERELALAEALLLVRDGKRQEAKAAFAAIDSGSGALETSNDVRARFQRALIAFAEDRGTDARQLADQVLAAQAEHAGARALVAKLETAVVKTDPLPPEDPRPTTGNTGNTGNKPPPSDTSLAGDYDTLVRRADAMAQKDCKKASDIYTKALEKKPNGVEALTGLGYCHLDAKNFASAHSRFRTALVISKRYEPALAGIAEAYQQQGRREDAIAAWRRYLEAYPSSRKGTAALERLGASAEAPPGGDTPAPAPTPTPTPTPTPPPADGDE